ncbi:MAG: ABC transporter substrate-binding protein [Microcoleaceae cyanobacterium]
MSFQHLNINLFKPKYYSRQPLLKFISLFCICFFLAVSCGQPTPQTNSVTQPENSDRITIGTTLKLRTLDPADAYELISGNLLYNLGDRLYDYEIGTTTLKPQLATALPTVSEDNLTYTIPLRQDVVFHDDTPFNAAAMAFSLQRFIDNGGPPSSLLSDTVESIEATGEYELTLTLKQPFAALPALLTFPGMCAVSPTAYEIGDGKFKPQTFVGTGPYQLADYGVDVMRLDAFENYWGEKPANSGIDLQLFSSPANLFNAFRSNAVNVAYLSLQPDQITQLRKGAEEGEWQVIEADGNTISYMVLNLNSEPLNKVEVRQAIAAVIDRPLVKQRVLQDQGESLYSLIPTTFEEYQPVFQDNYGEGDADKAKSLLQQAGYTAENPAVVELWYASNAQTRAVFASTLKALADERLDGLLQFEPKSVEATTAFQNLDKGIYPTFLLDWYADYLDADNYIQPFVDCAEGSAETGCTEGASQYQGSFYYSDRINQLIDQQRQESDQQARQAIFTDIQEIIAEDVPFIPLWQNKIYVFAHNPIENVRLQVTQQLPFWTINHSEPSE